MTQADLDKLKELDAVTHGPWLMAADKEIWLDSGCGYSGQSADAKFIVAMRNALPELIKMAEGFLCLEALLSETK